MGIPMNLIDSVLVPHTAFVKATNRIDQCYIAAKDAVEPICLPLIGESRTGKTRALASIEQKYPRFRTDDGLKIPVMRVKVPSKPTVKGLLEVLLKDVGDPRYYKDTETVKTMRLLQLIQHTETRIIMLDDLQHFYDRHSNKMLHHVADWLKNFMDESNVGFILAGLPSSQAVLDQNEQLAGRSMAKVRMPRFDWMDSNERNEFIAILEAFQGGLSGVDMPLLSSDEMAFRLYCACGGLIGYLTKILRQALWDASSENRNIIGLPHLATAFENAVWVTESKYIQTTNPFLKKFKASPTPNILQAVSAIGTLSPNEIEGQKMPRKSLQKPLSVSEAFSQ